ncbi:hypothetical protein [Bradyrhizobium sp. CCGB01]|uniref:hypothetical protein n=1 Tax=Bradyrhizobium sp. CCGB01 TaxID=2949634 RepID=UPI0020B40CB3|nr:hypothetical protein [Bradyrhizobium sp. CCGB01]MCP3408317.1 hypothetical protein [Bradyrhizobium sp. CCGB01]
MTTTPAFVLLKEALLPDETVLIDTLRRRHPGRLWELSTALAFTKADGAISIRAGDHLVVLLLMSVPLPFDQQLWQQASWVWPEAFDAAGQHGAHLIVSTMGPAVESAETAALSVIESTRLVTAVVGSLIKAQPGCLAVVWNGRVGRSPEMWIEQSRRAFEPFPDHPFGLWTEIVHYVSGKTIGAYTVGLSAFIGREIEFEVDGLDQRGVTVRVANATSHLLANGLDKNTASGKVFKDDDETIGYVGILHRNSRFRIGPVVSFFSCLDHAGRTRIYQIIPASIARNHPLLIMLGKVGLFDPAKTENLIELKPDHYVSETRLESFDVALSTRLSEMLATDAYAEADTNARHALARGDPESAKSPLQPWAEKVDRLQEAVKLGLILCDAFMFMPASPRSP